MNTSTRAQALLQSAIVWDNHGCMPTRPDATFLPQLERYRTAGVNVVSLNIGMADQSLLDHVRCVSFMRRWIAQHPRDYRLVASIADIHRCKSEGTLGICFDVEGMCPVQDDPSMVQTFYELGVRWMLIAYNRNNLAGGGCLDIDEGLTSVGRSIIDEMERVGMVLCLSHAGARTAAEALEYARNPPIFSHSNPSRITAHPRNISDELIRACARKGGVVGLSGIGPFLGAGEHLVERLLYQLRYVIDLVGAGHVGLGIDYVFDQSELGAQLRQNPALFAAGTDPNAATIAPEAMQDIAEGLARDNLTDAQIRAVLGENWLRVAAQVWR